MRGPSQPTLISANKLKTKYNINRLIGYRSAESLKINQITISHYII
jgi:hypothetical protein